MPKTYTPKRATIRENTVKLMILKCIMKNTEQENR